MTELRREQVMIRRDYRDMLSVVLATAEQGRRIERRIGEVRDDLEVMLKAELMGRLGYFEGQVDRRLGEIEARLGPR